MEVTLTPKENAVAHFPAIRKMGRKQGTGIAEGETKAKSPDNIYIFFPFWVPDFFNQKHSALLRIAWITRNEQQYILPSQTLAFWNTFYLGALKSWAQLVFE